jgi:4-hydroxy-tetrahydrodipicolinate synthase
MARTRLSNIRICAPVTPFAANGDFMADAYDEIVRWHLKYGATGFLVAADNGEHWALSLKEIAQITEITMRVTGGKLPVYVGAWAITEREAIERAMAAANAGAYGLCVKPQFYVHSWSPATEADIVGRFQAVGKAVPLPMMIYNSYNRTNVNISHEILHRICDVVDAECLKDTNGDLNFIMERVLQFRDKTAVLMGEGSFFMGMMLGAAGFISTNSDLFTDHANDMLGYERMSVDERRSWQLRQNELSRAISYFGTIPAGYKAALNMLGLPAGHLRDPLRPISPEQERDLRALLVKWGILASKGAGDRRSETAISAARR